MDNDSLLRVLDEEVRRHPRMAADDLVKLIYQATFGGDHMFRDPCRFRRVLEQEWIAMSDECAAGEPIQPIDPEGRIVRIHLGPCRERGVDVRELTECLLSQPFVHGTRTAYERLWHAVVGLAETGRIRFSAERLARLGFPRELPHHTPAYGPAAYRLIHDLRRPETREFLNAWALLR